MAGEPSMVVKPSLAIKSVKMPAVGPGEGGGGGSKAGREGGALVLVLLALNFE